MATTASTELVFSGGYLNGPMLGSGFAAAAAAAASNGDELHTLSQSISLEPIVICHQIAWYDELRRLLTAQQNSFRPAAAATYVNKPLPSMADLKDLKSFRLSIQDTCVKSRVRANKMDQRLLKLDKYCEYLTSKKQKRKEFARAGALNMKMGTQLFSINQRVEDRPKNILLNKRVRTSVAESRAKDGNLLKDNVGDSELFEKIRRLAAGGEGWDKRGKRKRSTGTVSTRHIDNEGVPKRDVQNKVVVENGSQPRDAHINSLNNRDDSLSNRKRPMPLGSSSLTMAAQWGGQRPQKLARARRPFLVSFASNQDEKQFTLESCSAPVGARLTSKETNGLPISKLATNDPKKLMVKLDNVRSSPRLSESHESVGGQSRLIDYEAETGEMNATENKNRPFINSLTPRSFQNRKTGCKKSRRKPGRRLKKLSDRNQYSPLQNVSSPDCPGASDDDREELLAAANHALTSTYLACSSPFWKKMEPVFASIISEDKSFLSKQVDSISDPLSENGSFFGTSDVSKESIPLYQRVLSALIIEDDIDTPEGDARNTQFINSFCVSTRDTHNLDVSSYENPGLVDKLVLELNSIGLCPDMMPVLEDKENKTIQDEIDKLYARLHQQEIKKKAYLEKISNNMDSSSRARDLEILAMDRLVEQAYRKLLARRSSRSGVPKQAALAFGNRTIARCHTFENSGISCFNEPPFHDILSAPVMLSYDEEAFPINGNRCKKKQVFVDDISSSTTTRMRKTKQKTNLRQQTPTPRNKSDTVGTKHPTGPTWVSSSNRTNDLDLLDEVGAGPDLGVPHDLTSFLNFDEQDPEVDFSAGLDIPMDDLTELF